MDSSPVDRPVVRELGRRRVFLFLAIFTGIFSLGAIAEESDTLLSVLDEYAVALLMLAVVAYIVVSWKRESLAELRVQSNVIVGLLVVGLAFMVVAVLQEFHDPADFRNELPTTIWLLIMLGNRFV